MLFDLSFDALLLRDNTWGWDMSGVFVCIIGRIIV
jgi:hypothetical protein